ncbi:hypothetical protein BDM02DRAFT_3130075 [Thelephora ganbajun]|uniref:Uncharacterized protein n=1 Tax=Thelephora ganbajun TaxID=370292 RepID=A0ACB6ZBM5_THEGA|nr:hypothetical protein BDM02DRAFT_3130075 [Thelephora ganbajun]
MLLWTTLLCLLSANLALSQFSPPEILAAFDPDTALVPLKDKLEKKDASDNVHLIRGLLMVRQSGCPTGYGECTNPAGSAFDGGVVQSTARVAKTMDAAGPITFVIPPGAVRLVMPVAKETLVARLVRAVAGVGDAVILDTIVPWSMVNADAAQTVVLAPALLNARPLVTFFALERISAAVRPHTLHQSWLVLLNFFSPPAAGYQCYRDASNTPLCRIPSSAVPPPLTNTNTNTDGPTATFISSSTTIPKGPSTVLLPSTTSTSTSRTSVFPLPSPSSNSNGSGSVSSAVSVGVNALLTLFAGVGAFAYLSC